MKVRFRQWMALSIVCAAVTWGVSGCGQRETEAPVPPEPVTEARTEAQTQRVTEAPAETETETVVETEAPRLVTSVDYTSKDGTIKITLPDNTWKIGQDADEMRVFQSGKDAMINIVHASTEASMSSLNVMTSQQALEESLTLQYADEKAFEVESFIDAPVNDVHVYRYTVKYNAAARMWAYSVTNAIVAPDEAYVVVGSITEDNQQLLSSVQKAVESFRVLKDEKLRAVTGEVISGTIQTTSERVQTDTASTQEMQSLKNYGTTATLVTVDQVNVRMAPGTDSDVIVTMNKNDQVTVTGETANWFQVNINGSTGYIRKDFLVYGNSSALTEKTTEKASESEKASETAASETDPYSANSEAEMGNATNYGSSATLYTTTDVNVRAKPGTDSDVTNALGAGNAVTVVGETDNWFIVSVDGATGYISKAYLSTENSAAAQTTDNTQTTDTAQTTDSQTAEAQTTDSQTDANSGNNQETAAAADNTGTDTASQETSSLSSVSGTVVGTTPDSLTIQGDDGNTYSVYYGDADMNSTDGIYDGVYVNINLDSTQAAGDGTLYATDVTGY